MQQLLTFLFKNKNFLIFLLLQVLAFFFTIQSHSYHKSKFISSANFITGGIYNKVNNFKEYIHLKDENKRLAEENVYLKNLLNIKDTIRNVETTNSGITGKGRKYAYIAAKIINNEYNKSNNYLTINAGNKKGIEEDLGVINSNGIIGITKNVSGDYATVLSILNVNSKINVKVARNNYFGTLSWNTKDYNTVQLLDLPVQAGIKKGDTIITGGMSTIFPEGVPVGTISDFNMVNNSYKTINITLFNDMSALGYVQIIKNFDREQIKDLEEKTADE